MYILDQELQHAIDTYLDACAITHRATVAKCRVVGHALAGKSEGNLDPLKEAQILDSSAEDFRRSFALHIGRNYVRIDRDKHVFGYIAHSDNKRVLRGYLLKAGARGPILNFARGNVLTGEYTPTSVCVT